MIVFLIGTILIGYVLDKTGYLVRINEEHNKRNAAFQRLCDFSDAKGPVMQMSKCARCGQTLYDLNRPCSKCWKPVEAQPV